MHEVLDELNFTQRGRAQRIKREAGFDISDRAINKWLSGETMPDHHNIELLAKFLRVNFNWLAAGQGNKYISSSADDLRERIRDLQSKNRESEQRSFDEPTDTKKVAMNYYKDGYIPIISWVAAGSFTEVTPVTIEDALDWEQRPVGVSEQAFGLIVQGRSMMPEFKPGEIICVETQITPWELKDGDLVVVHCNDDRQATFKQLIIGESREDMYLKPLNPDWHEQKIIPMGECELVGVVHSKITKYR